MSEKKKIGAGFVLTVITIVVLAVSLVLYLNNCKTNYFANMGVSATVVACLVITIILELAVLLLSMAQGSKFYIDLLPVISGVLTAIAAIQFIGSRIAGAASIMTFENNAENMADLNGAIVAMVFCVVALICVIVSSFFRVVKNA
jgi:hypothetical protein